MSSKYETVGIIGGGRFGFALAKLIGTNRQVLLYSRRLEIVNTINDNHTFNDVILPDTVSATSSLEEICERCNLHFPVVSSLFFKDVMRHMSPFLTPRHILIHGTKGFAMLPGETPTGLIGDLDMNEVKTMSEVILEETDVIRVGSLCGPNLATEILEGLPTATVIASEFDEVIKKGKEVLAGPSFFVFGSYDLKGAEMAGALKNVIALASGVVGGKELGKNCEAMLITRGLREMIQLGEAMGSSNKAFLGTAGIGDLIATATSDKSRNYTFGLRIARGEKLEDILADMDEVAEGVRSLQIACSMINTYRIHAPIIKSIYDIIFEGRDIEKSIFSLMKYPLAADVDFV